MLKEWLYIAGLLMTISLYLNTSQHDAVVSCWNKFMFLNIRYYIKYHPSNFLEVRWCNAHPLGLYMRYPSRPKGYRDVEYPGTTFCGYISFAVLLRLGLYWAQLRFTKVTSYTHDNCKYSFQWNDMIGSLDDQEEDLEIERLDQNRCRRTGLYNKRITF